MKAAARHKGRAPFIGLRYRAARAIPLFLKKVTQRTENSVDYS